MIALLITNSESLLTQAEPVLKEAGYDTISYHWLLKAMDNLPEIQPDLVLLSTEDYPRHWKILASYINTLNEACAVQRKSELILYTGKLFNTDDKIQSRELLVKGLVSEEESNNPDSLRKFLKINEIKKSEKSDKNNSVQEKASDDIQFMFTNPFTDLIVTGTSSKLKQNQFTFIPDILSHISQIENGTKLSECSLLSNGQVRNVKAEVFSVSETEPYGMEIYLEG